MATLQSLIARTRNELMTGWQDRVNQLNTGIDDSTTAIPFKSQVMGVDVGSIICIGLEEMKVTGVSGQSVSVIRGFSGSAAATHSADDLIFVAPSFSDFFIGTLINEGLSALSGEGLFAVRSTSFTFVAPTKGYDLPNTSDLQDIIAVNYDSPGPTREWKKLRRDEWRLNQNPDPTDFPSGNQLILLRSLYPGFEVLVTYKAAFTPLVNLTDDVESVAGLHAEAHDIPSLYAAYRINSGREVKRSLLNRQPDPRRGDEVPPGAAKLSQDTLLDIYESRVRTETRRLQTRYGVMV